MTDILLHVVFLMLACSKAEKNDRIDSSGEEVACSVGGRLYRSVVRKRLLEACDSVSVSGRFCHCRTGDEMESSAVFIAHVIVAVIRKCPISEGILDFCTKIIKAVV